MRAAKNVIISAAITGSVHTPTMSPHLPITPDDIVREAVGAAEAGAAILHLHARDPTAGRPTGDPAVFMEFLPRIKQATDAVINITTGGGLGMTMGDRLAAGIAASPEVCSLNMGSMNFVLSAAAQKFSDWKFDWEKPYLERTRDAVISNTYAEIENAIHELGEKRGARFELECYDVSHLYTVQHFLRRGLLKPPLFIQFIFGVQGGIGPDLENLFVMKQTADRLFGDDYYMSCLAAGRHQMRFVTVCAAMGGMVRVGLEDSLYVGPGQLAKSNAEQVAKIRRIIEELGLAIASPEEVRAMLQLKGADRVAF